VWDTFPGKMTRLGAERKWPKRAVEGTAAYRDLVHEHGGVVSIFGTFHARDDDNVLHNLCIILLIKGVSNANTTRTQSVV
jgi:hypothetical protein